MARALLPASSEPARVVSMCSRTDETPRPASVTVHWLGAAALAIASNGRCMLIDPYFSRLPLHRLVTGRPLPDEARITAAWRRLPSSVAAIVVGHTHIDHALDLPALARLADAPVFGSASLAALLARAGLPARATVCRPGDTCELPGLGRLTVFAGAHGGVLLGRPPLPGEIAPAGAYPLPARAYRAGAVLILDVTIAGRRFVHVGKGCAAWGVRDDGVALRNQEFDLSEPNQVARELRARRPVRGPPFQWIRRTSSPSQQR